MAFVSQVVNFLSENLLCLFYGLEVLAAKYSFFAAYHELLTDIAEVFGSFVALAILILSGLAVLVFVQQVTVRSYGIAKSLAAKGKSSQFLSYRFLFTAKTSKPVKKHKK